MPQILSFIPSAKTLWLLASGGFVTTIIAIIIPAPQGIPIAIALTFAWYLLILILATIDAGRNQAERIQVNREPLGKLSIGLNFMRC